MQAVRVDRGLTYGIGSRVAPTRAGGPFVIGTFTRNDSLAELDEVVMGELDRFHGEGPTDDEIGAVKRYLAGLQVRRVETPEALASVAAEAELHGLGLDSLERFRADVDAVTRDAARAAVAEALPRRDRLTVLVGDRSVLEPTAAGLGELTVVEKDFAEGTGGCS
jgi:zinc protease